MNKNKCEKCQSVNTISTRSYPGGRKWVSCFAYLGGCGKSYGIDPS